MRKVVKLDDLNAAEAALTPRYAQRALTEPIPKYELPEKGMDPDSAYQLIHDELLLYGSARLNLATFEASKPRGGMVSPPASIGFPCPIRL